MSDFAKALGLEEEIEHAGATYKLAPLKNVVVVGDFEVFMEDTATDILERRRAKLSPADYDRKSSKLIQDIAAGEYSFFSDASQTAVMRSAIDPSNKAGVELLYLRLREGNPNRDGITRQLARDIAMGNMDKILSRMRINMEPDPNDQAPATAAGGESASSPSSPASQESPSTSSPPSCAA